MRHNQNGRHMRGNRRGGGHHHHNNGGGNQRRVNPRVQTFDSNGPDVRIRGNAFQINEKYLALARDAMSAGDRVLAESYFQHAEHYLRLINEMNEEFARQNPGYQAQQPQPYDGAGPQPVVEDGTGPQPSVPAMNDLDQGFLVGPRGGNGAVATNGAVQNGAAAGEQPQPQEAAPRQQRNFSRQRETTGTA